MLYLQTTMKFIYILNDYVMGSRFCETREINNSTTKTTIAAFMDIATSRYNNIIIGYIYRSLLSYHWKFFVL